MHGGGQGFESPRLHPISEGNFSLVEETGVAKCRVRLFFSSELVNEPVVYLIGKQFDVVTNIRGGEVTRDSGWLYVELTGEDAEIARAIAWTLEQGVRVDPVEGDIIAG